jgi:hypothetical protein
MNLGVFESGYKEYPRSPPCGSGPRRQIIPEGKTDSDGNEYGRFIRFVKFEPSPSESLLKTPIHQGGGVPTRPGVTSLCDAPAAFFWFPATVDSEVDTEGVEPSRRWAYDGINPFCRGRNKSNVEFLLRDFRCVGEGFGGFEGPLRPCAVLKSSLQAVLVSVPLMIADGEGSWRGERLLAACFWW